MYTYVRCTAYQTDGQMFISAILLTNMSITLSANTVFTCILSWSRMNVTEPNITGARWDSRVYLHPANHQYLQMTHKNLTRVVPLFIWKTNQRKTGDRKGEALIPLSRTHFVKYTTVQPFELFLKGTYDPHGSIYLIRNTVITITLLL